MANANETSPAKKLYCVYATQIMYQEVEATSAEEAFRVAKGEPWFEPCDCNVTLDPDVKDVETDEFIRVGCDTAPCKTCASLVVATINDSNFCEGECGTCEYQRYASQPDLLDACYRAHEEIEQWDQVMGGSTDPRTKEILDALLAACRKAHGKAN